MSDAPAKCQHCDGVQVTMSLREFERLKQEAADQASFGTVLHITQMAREAFAGRDYSGVTTFDVETRKESAHKSIRNLMIDLRDTGREMRELKTQKKKRGASADF